MFVAKPVFNLIFMCITEVEKKMESAQRYQPHSYSLWSHSQEEDKAGGKVYLVVNGIMNDSPDAYQSATVLADSLRLDKRAVRVYFVDTEVSPLTPPASSARDLLVAFAEFGGFFLNNTADKQPLDLAKEIQHFISCGYEVEVHCHSRGALITDGALDKLSLTEQQQVSVVGYGGVRLISSTKAKSVVNVINDLDLIAKSGRLSLLAATPHDRECQKTFYADKWVDLATSLRPMTDKLQESFLNSTLPAPFELGVLRDVLMNVKLQRWISDGMMHHAFTDYIRHYADPSDTDVRVDSELNEVRHMGALVYIVTGLTVLAWQAQGSPSNPQ